MKRLSGIFLIFVVLNLLLSGCGDSSQSSSPPFQSNWHDSTPDPGNSTSVGTVPGDRGVVSQGGATYIKGVPVYTQRTSYWCGPTSLSMVFAFHGKPMDQAKIAGLPAGNPVYAPGGARYGPMVSLAKQVGFKNSKLIGEPTDTLANLKRRVSEGRPQVVSVGPVPRGGPVAKLVYPPELNPGKSKARSWGTKGHVVVVRGFTKEGHVVINDPSGRGEVVMYEKDFLKVWRKLAVDVAP